MTAAFLNLTDAQFVFYAVLGAITLAVLITLVACAIPGSGERR